MKRLLKGQKGTTLLELIIGISILGGVMSAIGVASANALSTQRNVIGDGVAVLELRKGLSWFSSDMKKAQNTDLVDGATPAASVTATWIDQFQGIDVQHSATYAVVGDSLVRTYDGIALTVARGVSAASFYRSGKTIHVQIDVTVTPGTSRTLGVDAVMRSWAN